MTTYDIRPLVEQIEAIVAAHSLGAPGAYQRWCWQDAAATRALGLNPYGCADAANILYTLGCFPHDAVERQGWMSTLRALQDAETGLFREATHHPIHTTAHCIAALELFDAAPSRPAAALSHLADAPAMQDFLDQLDWAANPWPQSHQGAGLYVTLVLTRQVPLEWQDSYFAWLWDQADPATGFVRRGCVRPVPAGGVTSLFPHLAGTFHYLFNHEYARRPWRYPAAMTDTCLALYEQQQFPLGTSVGFAEIDWVYCVTRSLRQCGHRFANCRRALAAFAGDYIAYLTSLDPATHDGMNDLHALFGAVCALAELQQALPGTIKTERPLRLVLDRRPFI